MKYSKTDLDPARARLLDLLPPGTRVYVKLNHTARSGMFRVLDLFTIHGGELIRITHDVCILLEESYNSRHEGLPAHGCGMDMGFDAVYRLGRALYPDGFTCPGETCRSNDHVNGDRSRSPHLHTSGGYALHHTWI